MFTIKRRLVVHDRSVGMMPGITLAANGDLLVTYNTSIDRIAGGEAHLLRSRDLGETWSEPAPLARSGYVPGVIHLSLGIATLSSGTVIVPFNSGEGDPWTRRESALDLYVTDSLDNGEHWREPRRIAIGPKHLPSYGKIVETRGGRVLMPVWGWDEPGDGSRAGVLISDDQGWSWERFSLIARADSAEEFDIGHGVMRKGGFNETTVVELPDGELLAIIRQQFVGGDPEKHFYRSVSADGGETWSAPERLDLCGTSPSLHLTASGRLMLGYRTYVNQPSDQTERGRVLYKTDGVAISWSEDRGRSWQGRLLLEDPKGYCYDREYEAGYPAMVNLPSGETLVSFYSFDEAVPVPESFPEPYHLYIAANILAETN
jgi:hypothetical protein